MVKKNKFIIDIIPLTRLPLDRQQHFSYLHDKKISAGSLVSIPLFRRDLEGIVIGSRPARIAMQSIAGGSDFYPHTNFDSQDSLNNKNILNISKNKIGVGVNRLGNIKLKKINEIIEENFLTENQLKLAEFISKYYICSLGIVLKSFIPKRMKARKRSQELARPPARQEIMNREKIILTKEQKQAINEISKKPASYYLFGPASSGKTEVYIESIKKLKKDEQARLPSPDGLPACASQWQAGSVNGGQALVLVPELTLTPQAIERYGQHFDQGDIAVLTSKISKGQFYENWQNIKSGKAKVIIGTRMAVAAPFKNLKLIVVDEEQDISFKQWDMSPRYDARKVAENLARICKARLVLGSAAPDIVSYHKAIETEENYKLLELPRLKNYKPPTVKVVDLKKEKSRSPISSELQSEIKQALKNKLQAILFINRQGMSSFSICSECKTILRCPKCERALVYDNSGIYKCLHCSHKTDALAACSKCKGMIFKNIGLGTQKVEREVNSIFPEAKTKRADFEAMKKIGEQEKLYQEFSQKKIDILIGTQMITKGWDFPSVGLVGIIDADNLLDLPDFKTNERAFQNMIQAAGRTSRLKSKFPGIAVIQTYNPENPVIKIADEMDFEKFYRKEIEERESLNYPPFGRLIKLVFQDSDKEKAEKETENVFREIKRAVGGLKNHRLFPPNDPLVSKVRGKHKKQIVIKFDNGEINKKLYKIISKLGKGWIIDVDPISII